MHRRDAPGRRARPAAIAVIIVCSVGLSACVIGQRGRLQPELSTTGDAAVDAVLHPLEQISTAVFTATYDADNAFAGTTTPVTIAQSAPDRRVTIIGDVSYAVEGSRAETCSVSAGECDPGIDPARTSDVQLGPDFYGTSATARLRTAAAAATGAPVPSTEVIEGRDATCVTIPLPSDTMAMCVFDDGLLARLDASDVDLTLTSVSDEADESLWP